MNINFSVFFVGEINSLLRMLVLFFYESKASDLQEALEALAKTVDESVNDIWNADQDSTSAMVSNSIFVLARYFQSHLFV